MYDDDALVQPDLSKRYGGLVGGINDIKSHPWFRSIDWVALRNRTTEAPIKPKVKSAEDTSNFEDYGSLTDISHDFVLSRTEQLLFEDF